MNCIFNLSWISQVRNDGFFSKPIIQFHQRVDISSVNRVKKLKEHTSEKKISGNKFQQRLKSQ